MQGKQDENHDLYKVFFRLLVFPHRSHDDIIVTFQNICSETRPSIPVCVFQPELVTNQRVTSVAVVLYTTEKSWKKPLLAQCVCDWEGGCVCYEYMK